MPLTGTFLADFTQFKTAVSQAELSLRGLETGAGKVSSSLNRMVDSFSGRKLIQDATLMTEAVTRIGGASRLTEAEQRKVNAAVTEAIAKYEALGVEARRAMGPEQIAAMRKLAEETKKATQENTQTTGSLGKLNSALGAVGLSLSGIGLAAVSAKLISFGKDAIDSAGHLKDLSAATGISATSLQQLEYAGAQVGVGLDQVTTGVQRMQRNLVEGDKSAVAAVQKLGLSVETLLRMNPAQAFETISAAISKIPDPAQRTAIAMEILGRNGAELLPLMTSNLSELEGGFQGMSETAVEGLDRLGDAFARWKIEAKASVGEAIYGLTSFGGAMQTIMDKVVPFRQKLREINEGMDALADRAVAAAPDLTKGLVPQGPDLAEFERLLKRQEDETKESDRRSTEAAKKSQDDRVEYAKGKLQEWSDEVRRHQEEYKDAEKALTDFLDEQATIRTDDAKFALGEWSDEIKRHNDEYKAAEKDVTDFLAEQDQIRVDDAKRELDDWSQLVQRHAQDQKKAEEEVTAFLAAQNARFADTLGDLSRAFGLLAQISGDSWGGVIKDIATAVAAMQTALEAVKAIEKAMQGLGMVGPGGFSPRTQGYINASIVGFTTGASVVGATDIRKGATGAAAGAGAGAAAGALYGSAVPGIGTAVGAGIGAIAGAIGGYFAARKAAKELRDANNEASKAIADMQKQLVSQYGPLQNIDKLGKQVGVGLAGAWGDQSIEGLKNFQALTTEFQEKVKALQDAVQEFGLTWKDLGKDQQLDAMQEQADKLVQKFDVLEKAGYDMGVVTAKSAGALLSLLGDIAEVGGKIPDTLVPAIARLGGMKTISEDNADALNKYIGTAISSGQKIPAALQPIIEKLIRMGKLSGENARALLGMSSEALPALDEIKAAADRYGLSLEQIGGKAIQIQIGEQAKQAVADWELLTSLGGDFGAVMAAMAPQVQSIVSDALKFGQQLPESMKPMIQAMIEAGQLTDDTGQKLTDISQLDFAADPTKKTQELIDKLGGFIDVLTGGDGVTDNLTAMSGDAKTAFGEIATNAKNAADAIKKEFSGLSFTIPVTYDFTNAGQPTGGASGYAGGGTVYAAKGWPWMPKGSDTVPAMLTPGERVLSLAETAKYDALMSGGSYRPPGPIIIKTYLNSRQIAEEVVPEIPGVVKRYGLTR